MTAGWKDVAVPKPYPRAFRDDVVRVARECEPGVSVEQVAKDFGVHPMTLFKWLRQAGVDEGAESAASRSDSAELREARKRIKLRLRNCDPRSVRSTQSATSPRRATALCTVLTASLDFMRESME